MRSELKNRLYKSILWFALVAALFYGTGRLYYAVTGGFSLSNITFALPYDARWVTHPLSAEEEANLNEILSQKFRFLGKGCQSYVFESDDGRYVIKFFKYQHFRPRAWIDLFTFIPAVEDYRQNKMVEKRELLERLFTSLKIAYEHLQEDTGVVYIHLNKSRNLDKEVIIYDKMGLKHPLNIDDYEFVIQRKAKMLATEINQLMASQQQQEAEIIIDKLLALILKEYSNGYADNDHALMQNTGILDGRPVHIDVGQFVKNNQVKNPGLYKQELFNKTWRFHDWLKGTHPSLATYLENRLKEIIGETEFQTMKPHLDKTTRIVLSNQE